MRLAMLGMAMVGMTGVRAGGFTIADLVFLLVAALILLSVGNGGGKHLAPTAARRASPMLLVGLALLTVGGLLATFLRSFDASGSAMVLLRLWYITIVWFWTLRTVCGGWKDLRRLLIAFVAGAVVNSVFGIFQEVTGTNEGSPFWGRSPGFTDHFNSLGTAVAVTIPLLIVWRSEPGTSPRWKRARLLAVVIALGGIGVSGSMTALAAAIVGAAATWVAPWLFAGSRQSRRAIVPGIIGATVVFLVVASGLVSLSVTERFTAYLEGSSRYVAGSVSEREQLNEIAVDEIIASPVVGVGLDPESAEIDLGHEPKRIHSLYYRSLYEMGILGFIGISTIFALSAHQAIAAARYLRRRQDDWIPIALFGSMTTLLADGFFSPPLVERYFWATFALISVTFGVCRAESLKQGTAERNGTANEMGSRPDVHGASDPAQPAAGL